ncbi:organic cation transporter-like protein isoform X2 [Scylla paramamosain]
MPPYIFGGAFLAPRLDYTCLPSTAAVGPSNASVFFDSARSSPASNFSSEDKCHYRIDTPGGERIEECVEFVFDNSTFSSTITSEFNLACDRAYLQTFFQSTYMFGNLLGSPVSGFLADKYGRKKIVFPGYVMYMLLGVVSSWLPYLSTILVARFLMGYLHSINAYTSFVHGQEVLTPKVRKWFAFDLYIFWAAGTMLYGLLGYLIRDWRLLQTAATLPGLLVMPVIWMIDESPRWLIVNGRPREALQVLTKVARWHGVDLPPEAEMKAVLEEQNAEVPVGARQSSVEKVPSSFVAEILVLFRTPQLRTITLCILFDFLIVGIVYYGMSLSGTNISDDPFMYIVLCGLMDVPVYLCIGRIMERFGRRVTLSLCYFIAAVVLLALSVTPDAHSTVIILLAIMGRMAAAAAFQIVLFYSNELFPTEVRSRGVGASFVMSCSGGIVTPFITDQVSAMYPWAPFVVFGVGSSLAGLGTLLLPETRGQTLPDTVAELEARAKNRRAGGGGVFAANTRLPECAQSSLSQNI